MFRAILIPRSLLIAAAAALIAGAAVVAAPSLSGPPRLWVSDEARSGLFPMGPITFTADVPLESGTVAVLPPVSGETTVSGHTLTFTPSSPLRPGSSYTFEVEAAASGGERISGRYDLPVRPLYDTLWVYVKVDEPPHRVTVFRGDEAVRSMLASGGLPGQETPSGVFRIQNRGYHFWSQKYGEGAYYWVRIFGNYLFHTVPVDIDGNIIPEEAERLGCPASHGCVRLSFPDAKWFYDEVPDGTLVVIDGE